MAASSAAASAPLERVLRTKEHVEVVAPLAALHGGAAQRLLVRRFEGSGIDGSSAYQAHSPDGQLVAAADKAGVDVFALPPALPAAAAGAAASPRCRLEVAGASAFTQVVQLKLKPGEFYRPNGGGWVQK